MTEEPATIVIDTREQRPFEFDGHPILMKKLDTGDYSIEGLEDVVAIERKELNDLVGSLTTGRKRFMAELERAKDFYFFAIVIESNWNYIAKGKYTSRMTPKSLIASLVAICTRLGIHVIPAHTKTFAAYLTKTILLRVAKDVEETYGGILRNE